MSTKAKTATATKTIGMEWRMLKGEVLRTPICSNSKMTPGLFAFSHYPLVILTAKRLVTAPDLYSPYSSLVPLTKYGCH
jgi:hypothetical protein